MARPPRPARWRFPPAAMLVPALVLGGMFAPGGAAGQLVSPGKLSEAHAELEGIRSCTRCHALRQPGVARDLCLACHEDLARRVAANAGFHGRLREEDCGACHKEHLGRAGDIVRFDSAAFGHEEATGFPLRGAHADAACRSCHSAGLIADPSVRQAPGPAGRLDHTYLGLATTCAACPAEDDPHAGQFARLPCAESPDETAWAPAPTFDHDRTAFPLTGEHADVACAECHAEDPRGVRRFRAVAHGTCAACHADPHAGAMGGDCASCHATRGWLAVAGVEGRFDHARTRFGLEGAHRDLACASCHAPDRRADGIRLRFAGPTAGRTYPAPEASTCGSCHVSPHPDQPRTSRAERCEACHGDGAWLPTTFDLYRHADARFPLDGAHAAVPCELCHAVGSHDAPPFAAPLECRVCHAADDPHGPLFADRDCGACHAAAGFDVAGFDHAGVPTGSCASCHADDDPHAGQFDGRSCDACHVTTSFRVGLFDHGATRFALEGAHAGLECVACHRPGAGGVIRWRPMGTACADCHGGVR